MTQYANGQRIIDLKLQAMTRNRPAPRRLIFGAVVSALLLLTLAIYWAMGSSS